MILGDTDIRAYVDDEWGRSSFYRRRDRDNAFEIPVRWSGVVGQEEIVEIGQ